MKRSLSSRVLVCASLMVLSATGTLAQVATSALAGPRPGRLEARRSAAEGMDAYRREEMKGAAALLELARDQDPILAAAWTNLSAVRIHLCQPSRARFAAFVARLLDPQEAVAAKNLSMAARLECVAESLNEAEQAEARIVSEPNAAEPWLSAAQQRRARGQLILAAYYTEQGLARGGDPAHAEQAARDLLEMGLLRQARAMLESYAPEGPEAKAVGETLATLAAPAGEIGRYLATQLGLVRPEEIDGLSKLGEVLLARGIEAERARKMLGELLGIGGLRTLAGPWGKVSAEREWFVVEVPPGPGAPMVVLRRFPGDLQLSVYRWGGGFDPKGATQLVENRLRARFAARESEWSGCADADRWPVCHEAEFGVDLGAEGRTRARIRLLSAAPDAAGHALVALIGDAGCGPTCHERARQALDSLLATFRPEVSEQSHTSSPANERWDLPLAAAWQASRDHSESQDPWRTHSLEGGARLDLPPGLCAVTVRDHNRALVPWPGARLWMRGRFEDREGHQVIVGNEGYAGAVTMRENPGQGVGAAIADPRILAPLADPEASLIGAADLAGALSKAGLSGRGVVARFKGQGFAGDWIVMRREIGSQLMDIHLPILEGRQSLSLLWVVLTARLGEEQPVPPIVDLSSVYEVRFRRFDHHNVRAEPREGMLIAAEAEVAVPRGYRVSMSAASGTGFPVRVRSPDDGSHFVLERWTASAGATLERRQRQAEDLAEGRRTGPWTRQRRSRGGESWRGEFEKTEGRLSQCAVILVPEQIETRPAFHLSYTRGESQPQSEFDRVCSMLSEMRYRQRAAKRPKKTAQR